MADNEGAPEGEGGTPEGEGGTPDPNIPAYAAIEDEGIRGLMETKGYREYGDVAKAYFNLNKLVKGSNDVIAIPGEEADSATRDAFYGKLGRPDTPEGYDIQLPEQVQVDDEFFNAAKNWMHGIGLNNEQANKFVTMYQSYVTDRTANEAEAAVRDTEAAVAEIKEKFGKDFDQALVHGNNAVKAFGLSDELLDRVESNIGAPALMEMIATIGKKISSEDTMIEGITKEGFAPSTAELQSRREAMQGNPEIVAALTDPRNPNHARYKREWDGIIDKLARAG